jgi:hypothetical protein
LAFAGSLDASNTRALLSRIKRINELVVLLNSRTMRITGSIVEMTEATDQKSVCKID